MPPEEAKIKTEVVDIMTASKLKFIYALILIDVALFLVLYDCFPLRIPMGGGVVGYPTANPRHLLLLCSAVILASIGAFLVVDNFYKWPVPSEQETSIQITTNTET